MAFESGTAFVMPIHLEAFANSHYTAARALWETTDGVGLSGADSRAAITQFLARNPGTSYVALDDAELVATILVGHDGRRGLIHHLAVAASHRRLGTAKRVVVAGLPALGRAGYRTAVFWCLRRTRRGVLAEGGQAS